MNSDAETLKSIIIDALTRLNKDITEELLLSTAEQYRKALVTLHPVSETDFEYIIKKIKEVLPIKMDLGVCIQDRRNNYTPWYKSRTATIKPIFWERFRQYLLKDKFWSPDVVTKIDSISDNLVGLLGDPASEKPFSRKGLVLGDVQSGKTVNFTAICNKAVDAGYRIVIIFSGTIETLRKQTQNRMDLEFAGINSYNQFYKIEDDDRYPGVSKYDKNGLVIAFTTNKSDFSAKALEVNNMSLHTVDPKVPIFFVIKKNVSILKNLLSWLRNPQNIDENNHISLPVLILDDEADNASVNVNDSDSDPTKTNAKIRELLKLFSKVSYLAITATPFANIFINPDTEDEMYEDDLFPRDFIYALSPPTSDQPLKSFGGYIGTEQIFGDTPIGDFIVPLEDIEDILPKKHKSSDDFSILPNSLEDAIAYFCLANVIRDIRGDEFSHRSMLIHLSHLKKLHIDIENCVLRFFTDIKYAIQNYSLLPIKQAMAINEIAFLKQIWDKFSMADLAGEQWEQILPKIYKSIAPIVVQKVNSGGGTLDYEGNKRNGLRVIAIGGNCLSRGLTLEGLMVSYFRRNTMMFDTLLQMGRWFGFRPGYADLCKIWMPKEIKYWFEKITQSYSELKHDIYEMQEQGKSPKDFGLKVRVHPGSLLPTARNKMREGKPLRRPITISGRLLETPRLRINATKQNEKTIRSFVSKLNSIGKKDTSITCPFWHDVSYEAIVDVLRNFLTDPWNLMFRGNDIANYIEKKKDTWDVAIMSGDGKPFVFSIQGEPEDKLQIKTEIRSVEKSGNIYKIMGSKLRVGAGGASKIGLSKSVIKELTEAFLRNNPDKKNVPDDYFFKTKRPPILMIHVIENKDNPDEILFAIGTGFPWIGTEEFADYIVDLVEWRQYNEEQFGSEDENPQEIE